MAYADLPLPNLAVPLAVWREHMGNPTSTPTLGQVVFAHVDDGPPELTWVVALDVCRNPEVVGDGPPLVVVLHRLAPHPSGQGPAH